MIACGKRRSRAAQAGPWAAWTLVAMCLLGRAWAGGSLVIDDDFADGVLNGALWAVTQSGPMTVSETEKALVALTPGKEAAKGRLALNTPAHGDWVVETDYDAQTYTGSADGRILLSASGNAAYAAIYYHRFDAQRNEIVFGGTLGGHPTVYAYHEQVPDVGRLRIARVGTTFTASYWDGAAWQSFGTQEGFKDDTAIRIQFQSTATFPAFAFRLTRFHLECQGTPEPIVFTGQPVPARRYIDEGSYTVKAAASGGLGALKYEWFRDGASGPISAGTGETLILANPTPEMSGKYWCKASDASGSVESKPAYVRFAERIAFTQSPEGAHRYTGESPVTFQAAAKGGVGPLSYAWRRDGVAAVVSTALPYTLDSPVPSDTGKYWCEATDGRETIKSGVAELIVNDRLAFTQSPEGAHRYTGESPVTFQAAAKGGVGPLSYAWRRDGVAAVVSTVLPYTLDSPAPSDTGTYWCEATDGRETIKSAVAELVVNDRLAILEQPVSATRFVGGEPVTLHIGVVGGLGPVSYKWFAQGRAEPVSTAEACSIETTASAWNGVYYCELRDTRDTLRSNTASIRVEREAIAPVPASPNTASIGTASGAVTANTAAVSANTAGMAITSGS